MEKLMAAASESITSPESLFGCQEMDLHITFDVNLGENFRLKARILMGGTQDKGPKLDIIYFDGIPRFSAYMFTDCVTQLFVYPVSGYRTCLPDRSLPKEYMDESRSQVWTRGR